MTSTESDAAARPRTTGEILDDAWRLYRAEAPFLLLLEGLFLVPAYTAVLALLTRPVPVERFASWSLPAAAAGLVALTGLGSGACQELLRRRASGMTAGVGGCLLAALARAPGHVAARAATAGGIFVGLVLLILPGLTLWVGVTSLHPLIAASLPGVWPSFSDVGRETRFDPLKAAAVVLCRIPMTLLAAFNLHLLLKVGLWAAANLGGFDTAVAEVQLTVPGNPVYAAALLLVCWLFLSPFFEACNFLLYLDTRARQEGLDLLYRVRRQFPARDRVGNVPALLAVFLLLVFGGHAGATADATAEIRAVREGVWAIAAEVRDAEPYPGGGRWVPQLRQLGRRLGDALGERLGGSEWFNRAVTSFARQGRREGLKTLEEVASRLQLLEETFGETPGARGPDGRPLPSKHAIKEMVPRTTPAASPKSEEAPKKPDREPREVVPDEPVGGPREGFVPSASASGAAGGFGSLGWLVLGGLLLAVLAVGVVLYRTSDQLPAKPKPAAKAPASVAEFSPRPDEQPPPVLWKQAEQLAAAGRHREAVRALYLAVLARLHQLRLLRYEPTRTNGEYVRQVRLAPQATPELHAAFARMTAGFEERWYGDGGCNADDFAGCRGMAEEVQSLARGSFD